MTTAVAAAMPTRVLGAVKLTMPIRVVMMTDLMAALPVVIGRHGGDSGDGYDSDGASGDTDGDDLGERAPESRWGYCSG